nr:hypothetical protein [Mediterraneibacter faecis]
MNEFEQAEEREKDREKKSTKEDQTAQTKNDDFRLYFVVHNHSAGSLCVNVAKKRNWQQNRKNSWNRKLHR